MLSTADLELTNFLNPDLTWKKVTKGSRSTRQSRKPATRSLNMGVELGNKGSKRMHDSSVFESEKLGVAVLERCFAEKVEHVPIKKRRLLLRASSPPGRNPSLDCDESLSSQPRIPSSNPEEFEQPLRSKCAAACSDSYSNQHIWAFDGSVGFKFSNGFDGVRNRKISEVKREVGCSDDFSGIALLAAAACSGSIDDDTDNVSSGTCNFFQKDLVHEENMDDSFVPDNYVAVSHDDHNNENCVSAKRTIPSKDDRLHWDLNTVMDAWEEPCDDSLLDSRRNDSECVLGGGMQSEKPISEGCEKQRDYGDGQRGIGNEGQSMLCRVSSDTHGTQMLLGSRDMKSNIKEHKLEQPYFGLERSFVQKKCDFTPTECVPESLNDVVTDTKAYDLVSMDTSLDGSCCPRSHHTASTCVLEEKITVTSASVVVQHGEDGGTISATQLDKSSLESVQAGKHGVVSTGTLVPDNAACEIDIIQCKDGEYFRKASGSPDNRTSPTEVTCWASDVGNSINKSYNVDHSNPSPKCEALSASSTSIAEGQFVEIGEGQGHDDKASAADTTVIEIPMHIEPKEVLPKCDGHLVSNEGAYCGIASQESCRSSGDDPTSCNGKLASEDPLSDYYVSDFSQDDQGQMVGVEKMSELQVCYDSPFEDGELREPDVYPWEENDDEDGETECVDYDSDNGDRDEFDTADYSIPKNFEVGHEGGPIVEKGSLLQKNHDNENIGIVGKGEFDAGSGKAVEQCVKGDGLKEQGSSASLKAKISVVNHLQECHDDVLAEGNADGLHDKGLLAGEAGSRGSGGKLTSRSEGPPSLDAVLIHRSSRSDYLGASYSQAERDLGSDKSMARVRFSLQVRGRDEANGHWFDSSVGYWDARNHYPQSYRGREGHGYSRPRSVIANSAAKVGGSECHDDRRSINYSSKGVYRPFIRRRSPTDRDNCYGVHRVTPPMRGIGRDRSRGRSGIYAQGVRRGPKEEYHDPLPDDAATSSVRMPHYLARRERRPSPNYSRDVHFSRPRRKSRSRSRTRSPLAWNLNRDRSVGTRRHSPDLRSDTRMDGMRLQFQKPSFAADFEESFMSSPRGRLSPQRNSRWFDDQNCMDDHLRDRRSPVRMFRRSQRFDSVGYSGRSKPIIRPGRFPQIAGAGRGRKYQDSDDDRRKYDDRYEMIHRVRRYDASGVVRRFRYDMEDCFEARNSHNEDHCFRSPVRRDAPRSGREERGPRYNSDRVFNTASPSRLRNFDEQSSPRGE